MWSKALRTTIHVKTSTRCRSSQTVRAKGLAWVKVVDGELNGPVAKFLTGIQAELTTALALEDKDLVLFVADMLEVANATLGALRGRIAKELGLIDNDKFNFLWVVDWPMFEWSEEEGRYMSAPPSIHSSTGRDCSRIRR